MAEKWIQKAIKKPGALRATAKRAGALTKRGTIDPDWLRAKAKGNSKTAKRARLALTLKKMRKAASMAQNALSAVAGKKGRRK